MNSPPRFIRPRRVAIIVALTFVAGPAPAPAQIGPPWQQLGPAPIGGVEYTGRIAAIAASRNNANLYFVAGADGGVWRTLDGGLTWSPMSDALPSTAMGALAIDPVNESVIYAGSGEANFANHSRPGAGLFKSIDAGATWTVLASPTFAGRCFSRIQIDPAAPSTLFAATTPPGGFPAGAAAKGHPQSTAPVGVHKSIDAGQTWTRLSNGIPELAATDLVMQPGSPQILYAGIGHIFGHAANGVYKSLDGGASWTRLTGGLPTSSIGRIALAVAPTLPQRVVAAIAAAADPSGGSASTLGVFRSDNGGASWTSLSPGNYQATYGWYLNVVTVRPSDANAVFLGGLSLLRSTTAAAPWTDVTPPHVDLHALEWDAAGRLLAGDDGGLQRSTDLGNSWSPLNVGLGVTQYYAGISIDSVTPGVMYGGLQDNGTSKRMATGAWTQLLGGDGGFTAVDPNNSNIVFVEFQGSGNLYRSTTGGGNLTLSNSGISAADRNCFEPPFEFDPTNSQRMIYATHRVYQSLNGGATWTPISGDLTTGTGAIRSLAVARSNPQCIWVTTTDGNVQVTFNNGGAWNLVRTALPGWPRTMRQVCVAADNHLTAYLAASRYGVDHVLRTTDGGASWTPLDGNLPDLPVNVIAVDVRSRIDVLYVGTEAGVYRSVNGGMSWHRFGQALPNCPTVDLRLDPIRERLVAATQGRGAWQIPIWVPGDLNSDGVVNPSDVPLFVSTLLASTPSQDAALRSDMNADGAADGDDVQDFLNAQ